MSTVMGIVLAGGKSSRMGRDKAELAWGSKNLLQCQIDKLARLVGNENVFISGKRPGLNSISDLNVDRGPIEGLKTVLASRTPKKNYAEALVVPIDMPLLTAANLEKLMREKLGSDGKIADAIKFQNFQFPVLFNNLDKIEMILAKMELELLSNGDSSRYSYSSLYKSIVVREIAPEDPTDLLNTNTNEEWIYAISKADHIK